METGKPRYGSDLIADMLRNLEIPYVAFNPGATFRGIHDSLVNYLGNSRPEIIECCHEEVAVAVAHGYAKATGKPMAVLTHNIVGLQHASMAIFNAWCDLVPILVLGGTGPMDFTKRRPWIDWIHTALVQGNQVRDYVKWDDQPHTIAAVPESLLRAYHTATRAPQGPVYVCFDVELQEDELTAPVELPPASAFPPPTPLSADEGALRELAAWLVKAEKPVLMAGLAGRQPQAFYALVDLAELLAAPVVDPGRRAGSLNLPSQHPLALNGFRSDILGQADVVLGLEVEDLHGQLNEAEGRSGQFRSLVAQGARLAHLGVKGLQGGSWAANYQRLQRLDLNITGELACSLPRLLEICRTLIGQDPGYQKRREQRWEENRAKQMELRRRYESEAEAKAQERPIAPAWLALQLRLALGGTDYILANGNLKGWALRLWDLLTPGQYLGGSGGGGLGYGPGAALGVALAYRESGKVVVNLQDDGDFLYAPTALWTAAHYRLPLLTVVYNNRTYFNSENHQGSVARRRGRPLERAGIGTELVNPAIDFSGLARSFGLYAEGPVEDPAQVLPAVQRALAVVKSGQGPALVDVITRKEKR